MLTGVSLILWFVLCENPCLARRALEDQVCSMNWPMHCSQEGLYDPDCTAFFSPRAVRFSCSNFVICGENNGFFTNTLYPAVRVESSVGRKRYNFIYSWIWWGGVWWTHARTKFWAGFLGCMWWNWKILMSLLEPDELLTKWHFEFVFCAELAEESGDLGHSPGAWFCLHCTTEILSNTVGKISTDRFKISKILQEL